jgi:hypothetical protein
MPFCKPCRYLAVQAVLFVGLCASGSARADDAATIIVRNLLAAGEGCPAGSLAPMVKAEGGASSVELRFASFASEGRAPRGDQASAQGRMCSFTVELEPRKGYQIGLVGIRTRVFADVLGPRNTRVGLNNVAKLDRSYFFSAANATSGYSFPIRTTYLTETLNTFLIEDEAPGPVRFADCNTPVIARSYLRLSVSGEYNVISLKSADRDAGLTFDLMTRACAGHERIDTKIVNVASTGTPKNVCLLDGVGSNARTKVCYDANGEVVSRDADRQF